MRKGELSKWDKETEVLVVGYGFAGAVAAIDAHDAGAKVLLIEKEAHPAGCSPSAGGTIMWVSNVEKAFWYLKINCGGRTPDDVIRAFCEEAYKIPDYIKKLVEVDGAEYAESGSEEFGWGVFDHPGREGLSSIRMVKVPGFTSFPWYHGYPTGGTRLVKVLMENIDSRKIPLMFSTPATELVQDEITGEIVGIIAEKEGKSFSIKCKKAVILACGGFEQNEEMRQQFTQGISWISMCHTSNT
ncbi:FAD-dependent oxidoreductase, partial [Chloroflexota bacterium]